MDNQQNIGVSCGTDQTESSNIECTSSPNTVQLTKPIQPSSTYDIIELQSISEEDNDHVINVSEHVTNQSARIENTCSEQNNTERHHVVDLENHVTDYEITSTNIDNEMDLAVTSGVTDTPNRQLSVDANIGEESNVINVVEHCNSDTSTHSAVNNMMEQIFVTNVSGQSHVITITQQPITTCVSDGGTTTAHIQANHQGDTGGTSPCNCNCHTSLNGAVTNLGYQNEGSDPSLQLQSVSDQSDGSTFDVNADYKRYLREISNISTGSTTSTTKPPTYDSLGEHFLSDEPPKYQDITGKNLDTELVRGFIKVLCQNLILVVEN